MENTTPIHYLKARNSDFLAGTDLEIFDLEGKSKTLTIANVKYEEDFMVNGKKKAKGLVIYFKETYAKPFIVNTTNSTFIRNSTGVIDASKWIGFSIEFFFDSTPEMKISRTETKKGGIRIKSVNTNGYAPALDDIPTRISKSTNRAELMAIWNDLSEAQQIEHKETVQTKYKSLK